MSSFQHIEAYISFRYPNWRDRAVQLSHEHHFVGWEDDLLQNVIMNLLDKPKELLYNLYEAETSMIVNGKPTRELDKYVLHMLRVNAFSTSGQFRTRILGERTSNQEGQQSQKVDIEELEESLFIEEENSQEEAKKIRCLHAKIIKRMRSHKVNALVIEVYRFRCIDGSHWKFWNKANLSEAKEIEKMCIRYATTFNKRELERNTINLFIKKGWIPSLNLTLF
ncbi:hypothetical protein K5X82_07295 [Halosquirtibacter xylanolyticus]|uniref:hypothetical protein n=1 Tax=Halosquirtibacter xylanolyticus TaxID=3374599 RepID=UPI00374951EC|nr:hypothetical protein K5X82_07295 [Prolixibacteraceae bacterium]